MKSQDIGLLLKIESMRKSHAYPERKLVEAWPHDWQDWHIGPSENYDMDDQSALYPSDLESSAFTARSLERLTGISKSQVNISLKRSIAVGLAKIDRRTGVPKVNVKALFEFIVYGLKFVFPVKPGELTRGIATTFEAPVLKGRLLSAGEFKLVWPNADGKTKGLSIEPLFTSIDVAIRNDPQLYAALALVDAIRLGQPRESLLAQKTLEEIVLK